MAEDWTGSDFGKIDDQLVGDGSDGSTRPADTLLEHMLLRNERYLEKKRGAHISWSAWGQRQVSAPPRISPEDYDAGRGYTIYRLIPYWIQSGLERLRVRIVVSWDGYDTSSATTAKMKWRARFAPGGYDDEAEITLDTSKTRQTISLTIDPSDPIEHTRREMLLVECLSEVGEIYPSHASQYAAGPNSQTFAFGGTSPGSGDTLTASDVKEHGGYNGQQWEEANAAFLIRSNKGGTNFEEAWVQPKDHSSTDVTDPPQGTTAFRSDFGTGLCENSWCHVWGITIEEEYADNIGMDSSGLAAQQEYDASQSSYMHARTTKRLSNRRRPISLGYEGQDRATEDEWPSDYPEYWMYAFGDQGAQTIGRVTGQLDRDDPVVESELAFIGVQQGGGEREDFEELREDARRDKWELTATVEQLGDGDTWSGASTLDSATVELTATHYPTDTGPLSPFLLQMYWAKHGPGASPPNRLGWLHHEGRLWPVDQRLVSLHTIRVDLGGDGLTKDDPVRVKYDAEFTNQQSVSAPADWWLVGVGLSVWEAA